MKKQSLFFALIPLILQACSFSDSSESSSASSKSSFDSIGSLSKSALSPSESLSNSSMNDRQKYTRDVRDYTAEFVKSSNGSLESFRSKIAQIAEKRGIANWSEDKATYVAIGKGLRKADLPRPQFEALKASLGNNDARKMGYIQEGFD